MFKPADKIRFSLVSNYTDRNESEHISSLEITKYPMVEPLVVRRKQYCITYYDGDPFYPQVISYNDDNSGANDTYDRLYSTLVTEFSSNYAVEFFAYDWRMSNEDSATRLEEYINNGKYEQVILVAHSMGNLISSNYLAKGSAQQAKIKKLITLGTPFLVHWILLFFDF